MTVQSQHSSCSLHRKAIAVPLVSSPKYLKMPGIFAEHLVSESLLNTESKPVRHSFHAWYLQAVRQVYPRGSILLHVHSIFPSRWGKHHCCRPRREALRAVIAARPQVVHQRRASRHHETRNSVAYELPIPSRSVVPMSGVSNQASRSASFSKSERQVR